jgi:DNA-binding transcriptional LysR family regulator
MHIGDLEWLLAIARAGSLSAAAKARGVAVSTAGRRLDALEAELKLRLVDRRRDGVRLTSDGARIAALAEPAIDSADRIGRAAAAMRASGDHLPVVVSATEFVVSEILAPALPTLWARHPDLPVTLRSQAEVVSLAARDADLAIRMSRPEAASLVAKKLPPFRLGLFASAAYLAGRDPARLRLSEERLLIYDDSYGRLHELDWVDAGGFSSAVALRTGSSRALLAAAEAGAGIALLPAMFARARRLVEVSAPSALVARTPWLIAHSDLRRLPTIRVVHAWLVGVFAALHRGRPAERPQLPSR